MSAHAGFDRSEYPGDDLMRWLWDNTNLAWTGFYLAPAPSHPNAGWMGTRQFLSALGWGFAPLYLGQQAQGPGSHVLNSLQGYFDGIEAASLALRAGFPSHSVIYLDIEQGPPLGQPAADYYKSWVQGVFDQGYYPGVYCSFLLASQLDAIDYRPVMWTFHLKYPNQTYQDPLPTPDPSKSGYSSASVWQLMQGGSIRVQDDNGLYRTLSPVDLDSADTADPSNFMNLVQVGF